MTLLRLADRAASNRDNNLGNSGTQTTSPKNVLPKEERTQGRTAKNKIRVNSGEHHKRMTDRARHPGVGL